MTNETGNNEIERIAQEYGLDPEMYSGCNEKDNKVFLAMLDHYAKRINLHLPDRTYAMDFGCGHFLYGPALTTFLLRHNSPNSNREVNLINLDGEMGEMKMVPTPCKRIEGLRCGLSGNFIESPEDIENECYAHKYPYLDFVSCFNLGGSGFFIAPGFDFLSVPAEGFKRVMSDGAVLFLTTSYGGQDRNKAIRTLDKLGYEILINEPNKYARHRQCQFRDTDDLDIIIARCRKAKE